MSGMHKVCLIVIVLLVVQGTRGNTLGVAPSLREMWAELMGGTSTTAGVCGKGCYVEIAGTAHFFEYQYFDKTNPCKEYICDTASGNVVTQMITCADDQPCESQTQKVFLPGKCCPQCRGVDVDVPRVTEWSEWTKCSETCGLGQRARSRTCIVPENVPNVGDCSGVPLLEFGTCNLTPCPVDCEWEYGRCERCSVTCGSGTKLCPPVIRQKPHHGGRDALILFAMKSHNYLSARILDLAHLLTV
ncbi:Adhesion G protein-coupled receptor B3 [Geodia barretti]|uniref:Adhesion G protein-coupled receptor B3 n=1 Tax=Geodia barretti TaxID=519541 RepID=A0AA35RJ86_GEOBA|nr:Adhesion G protein-coupled receptor B3 [Geodia barretti]